ncbi:hypothetical protein [Bacillus sp. J37]|uniref:hypothetical protein n=1 Tax=Bacillus sp. J37 TaxID=935837 RepID=UPI00047AA11F|nr:hypothetical protein [Bacillus sp. J37]
MAVFSTGPVLNNPVNGVRQTQQVTIKMENNDSVNSAAVLIYGYHQLNNTKTLYVLEQLSLAPKEVITRNHFVNFDVFEFVFATVGPAAENTQISVLGKSRAGVSLNTLSLVSNA